jgi:hypothetical protein
MSETENEAPGADAPQQSDLDYKINLLFSGVVVRKDLVKAGKGNAIVPTYVLEYLLGQYAASDDEATIQGRHRHRAEDPRRALRPPQRVGTGSSAGRSRAGGLTSHGGVAGGQRRSGRLLVGPGSGDRVSISRYPLVSGLSRVVGAPLTSSACARFAPRSGPHSPSPRPNPQVNARIGSI